MGLGCCIIGIVRFWQIHVINLVGNLTGTSLTTFMLCTVELMLAGICISIPMLRPSYLGWREKYKNSRMSNTDGEGSYNEGSGSGQQGPSSHKPSHYTAWIELNDKDQETDSNDDGSERHLTRGQPSSAIHVSKNWAVTKEPRPR
ncbi:hypothetical protein FQN52_000320 [Onygenales sp. PD_12]|nr:hypothetical protein FQN52_000320 [Onygenales sp. PD_12]